MKAICTKRIPFTDYRPTRIKAYDSDNNRVEVAAQSGCDYADHERAALALVAKMQWQWGGRWVGGWVKDGMVFVNVDGAPKPSYQDWHSAVSDSDLTEQQS